MAISAKFLADFSQFTTAVEGATGSLKTLETSAQTLGPAILASLASGEIRRFASDVMSVAKDFVGAFAEEEAAVKKLTVALQKQGTYTPELVTQYKAMAEVFQKTTTYSDELVASMMALLVQVGDVAPEQMQQALKAATNLSAGLGIDLQAATLAVAKGFEGGTTALLKMAPSLKGVIKEGASMNQVMLSLEERFGGQAQAQIETTSGKMKVLANQMSDFKEKVGELIVRALTPMLEIFQQMPEGMQTFILGAVAIGTALAPLALSVAALTPIMTALGAAIFGAGGLTAALAALGPYLGPAGIIAAGIIAWYQVFKNLDVFIWAAKASWDMLTGVFRSAAAAITGYAQQTYEGVKTWLVDRFQAIVAWVQQKIDTIIAAFRAMMMAVSGGSIVPDMVKGIEAEFKKLDRVMVQPVIQATRQTVGEFQGLSAGGPTLLASAGSAAAGGGVVNHIYVNGTAEDVARKVAAEIMRTVKAGSKVSGA